MSAFKENFIEVYKKHIHREGADKLLQWLKTTDFFTAPASTKYHGAHEGGLDESAEETIAICALLHDVCKANFYKTDFRNQKNSAGEWEKVPYYTVSDQFSYGHGEKSVWLIQRFMRLSIEESIAIRWHMGGFDEAVKGGSRALSKAYEEYPSALLLHIADMKATYMLDN